MVLSIWWTVTLPVVDTTYRCYTKLPHCTRFGQYCTVGNFRGRKLLQISQFCGYLWKFSPQNFGRCFLWCGKSEQAAKVLSTKIIFFSNLHKFSPSKVSLYTVPCFISCAILPYTWYLHCSLWRQFSTIIFTSVALSGELDYTYYVRSPAPLFLEQHLHAPPRVGSCIVCYGDCVRQLLVLLCLES